MFRFARCACLVGLATTMIGLGCGGPKRASTPDWDVEAITEGCMEQCDKDGDEFISQSEAKENAPGLAYAFRQLDIDGDKKLSREEVRQRFQDYEQSGTGYQSLACFVLLNGSPLRDAQLHLVPEPFLADYIGEAEGEVYDENTGKASVATVGEEGSEFGIRTGMYRVQITSPSVDVPAKYNTETELGVEASTFTNPYEEPGGIKFRLQK